MADLTVTLTDSVTINGVSRGSTNTLTIASIVQTYERVVSCPAGADTTVATFQTATSTSDGAIDLEDVKYIRVTNLDDTNPMNLSLQVAGAEGGTANMSATILVSRGQSIILWSVHDGIALSDANATIVTALTDLESLLVDPLNENIDVEVLVASI